MSQPNYGLPDDPALNPEQTAQRTSRFWWLLIAGCVVGMLVYGGIAAYVTSLPDAPTGAGVATIELADGTFLTLEAVTHGSSHQLELPVPNSNGSFWGALGGSGPTQAFSRSTSPDATVIWLTRRNRSGRAEQFDWWSYAVLFDERGTEVLDDNPVLSTATLGGPFGGGVSTYSGDRPLKSSGRPEDMVVAHSVFPKFRHTGPSTRLRIYDIHQTVVAEFEIPVLAPTTYPDWTPESLPATKSDGDVSVTLTDLRLRRDVSPPGDPNPHEPRTYVNPKFDVAQNGQPSEAWQRSIVSFEDALGNHSHAAPLTLSLNETAWKMHLTMFRKSSAEFAPGEMATIAEIPIPADGVSMPLAKSVSIGPAHVELVAIGGAKDVTHNPMSVTPATSHSSGYQTSTNALGSIECHFELRGGVCLTRTKADVPHVFTRVTGLPAGSKISLRIADEQGRDVGEVHPIQTEEVGCHFFMVPKDAKSLTVTALLNTPRQFEFQVKPPEAEVRSR